jgi:ribosomal protein S27E
VVLNMQHTSTKVPAKCAICGAVEPSPGSYPMVVGVGRVCLNDGMKKVKCEICGTEVKLLTSSRLQGKTLCLSDHMKEIEKFRQHIVQNFDEDNESATDILTKAYEHAPEGYTLLAVRRGRNSTHLWEAEYEKTEVFEMRCS